MMHSSNRQRAINMAEEYKFGIVGAGPIGSIMGAHLAKAGHHVVLVDILKDHLDEIKKNGLMLTGVKGFTARFSPENLCYSIDQMRDKDVNTVFIAIKASLMNKVVPLVAKALKPSATVISLQNGLDTEECLAETFGKERTLRIIVNYAGNVVANGKVKISFFNPPNYIGTITPVAEERARKLAEVITGAGLETSFTREIKKYEWEKIILNSALSPVCALTRRTMRQMMEYEKTRELAEAILREGIEVAKASGIHLDSGFLEYCMSYLDKAGHHKTSMHVDIERGSPTEVAFINGKIVEHGKSKRIPTPYNSAIVSLIKGSELPEHKE